MLLLRHMSPQKDFCSSAPSPYPLHCVLCSGARPSSVCSASAKANAKVVLDLELEHLSTLFVVLYYL